MKKIIAQFYEGIVTSNTPEARTLCDRSSFGKLTGEKIRYSFVEVLFLIDKERMEVFFGKKRLLKEQVLKKMKRFDRKLSSKFLVFKDMRERGYILKNALKFGADFRVYEQSKKPGKVHSKWILYIDSESKSLDWHEFSAKNRVAHSTKKKLLIAIVDEENDISYYEVNWFKP